MPRWNGLTSPPNAKRQTWAVVLDVVAETDLNLVVQPGLAHYVDIDRLGLVIVLESADFRFVEFNQPDRTGTARRASL
jgi:hypothetical protein